MSSATDRQRDLLATAGIATGPAVAGSSVAVAAGAWPVVRRLTRRLEALKQGVEAFGAGALHQRVAEDGRDEVTLRAPAEFVDLDEIRNTVVLERRDGAVTS